jgi:lysophospholipase L1-like esterase
VLAALVVLPVLVGCGGDQPGDGSPAQYVAIGDSFTSGPGIPDLVDEGCFRSDANYPSLVAAALDLKLDDVSCGGAATTALVGVQETPAGPVPPQFGALTKDTELVTVGLGFNDQAVFGELLTTCMELAVEPGGDTPCRDHMNASGSDYFLDSVGLIQTRLTSALTGIRDRSPDARVVLVGYPQLVPDRGRCAALPLAPGDYDYVREVLVALGTATEEAARATDSVYIDVLAASRGHDVCAGDEAWVSGVVADPAPGSVPMHPYATQHRAVADLVIAALDE